MVSHEKNQELIGMKRTTDHYTRITETRYQSQSPTNYSLSYAPLNTGNKRYTQPLTTKNSYLMTTNGQ